MRLSKSLRSAWKVTGSCCFSKTVAQLLAEQSLTILIGVYPVKRLSHEAYTAPRGSHPVGQRRDEVVALLSFPQNQVLTVKRLVFRRHGPSRVSDRLAVELDGTLGDQLASNTLGAGQPG